MNSLTAMLERQAAWQRSRAQMSWSKKLRLARELRKAALALRDPGRHEGGGGVTSRDIRQLNGSGKAE
jgi:hypothetical protein